MSTLGPGVCTYAERLAEYADRRLPPPDCDEVESHLETCGTCRAVLAEVTAFVQRERGRIVSPAPDDHRFRQAIAALADEERAALCARYDDGLGIDEIAQSLGLDTRAVRMLLATTVMKLRRLLARQ